MDEEVLLPIVLFGCLFGVVTAGIAAKAVTQIICHWRDTGLKTRMVDAGYSAAEIERVVAAGHSVGVIMKPVDVPPVRKPAPVSKPVPTA